MAKIKAPRVVVPDHCIRRIDRGVYLAEWLAIDPLTITITTSERNIPYDIEASATYSSGGGCCSLATSRSRSAIYRKREGHECVRVTGGWDS